MKKYVIAIEESYVKDFEVEAEDLGEALNLAEEKYRTGEFSMDGCTRNAVQMAIDKPSDEATEWIELKL